MYSNANRGGQTFARTAADAGNEHRRAVVDGADHRLQAVLFRISALAVVVHSAVPHKLRPFCAHLVDLELPGVAKMLIDAAPALGGNRDQNRDAAVLARQRLQFRISGGNHGVALQFHLLLVGSAALR